MKKMISEVCDMMRIGIIQEKAMEDLVHMCLSVPTKYSLAEAMKQFG